VVLSERTVLLDWQWSLRMGPS